MNTARHLWRTKTLAAGAAGIVSFSLATAAVAAPAGQTAKPGALPATAADQIAALQQMKTSLTPAERKLDSRLALIARQQASPATTNATPKLQTGVTLSKSGTTAVDVEVTAVSSDLLSRLRGAGATVAYASPRLRAIRADVPVSQLSTVASWKDVVNVRVATGAITAHEAGPAAAPVKPESKEAKGARLDARLKVALAAKAPPAGQGAVVSEGDKADAVDKARTRTNVTGTGVKVCVLSDGVTSLAKSQAAGELPVVDVLPGQQGDGDEGTAMLEIVHDLAPNASLGFATAFTSGASFADNIRGLRFRAHCDIIVDDVIYFNEDPFQDGPIAQSVNAVTDDGAMYFSSAGNEGNTIDGTSGNFEGNFVRSGRGVGKFVGSAHDFDPGTGVQVYEPISDASSAGVPVTLFWADPLGAAGDDYDLYLFDAANNVVAFSQDVQSGTQDPFEILQTPLFGGSGLRLAVVKFAGADRYFQLSALRGRFSNSADGLVARVTPGVTRGHSAAVNAFSVAAAPAATALPFDLEPGDPPNPSGPFPKPFTTAQKPERFTSDGPRRVFFNADGSPLAAGGVVRQKPDITAADGVSTSVAGFSPFFGTSAAAPHAAAIAALVLSGNPGASTADVREAFNATALDLTPAGVDARTGAGVLRADRVLAFTGATPQPLVVAGEPTLTPVTGDGDAFLEPGETATAHLPAVNQGDGTATGVSVRLTSADPLATVTPRTRAYGSIAAGTSKSKDFTVKLAASYPLGKPLALSATVTFAGVLSPQTTTVHLGTGEPAATPTTFAYTGPALPIPDNDPAGASVTLPVSGIGYANQLTFSIDGTTCTTDVGSTTVGIDHSYVSDLVGTLSSPGGQTASLFVRIGLTANNMCQVVFDDAAAKPISFATSADAPFTGSWRPNDPLAPLAQSPVDGNWTFTVADVAALDTGSIRAVSLHVRGFVH